ncbi:unnamed protein product [Acanthoscelides obtectus]|uniref:tRNA-specific adenosine deaminase 1 n=1 Tax=Acanthoscelides obtectus TaxID=200917 RepID=A0A9P0KKJ7_ACAOB|nr:unnamed protein product [Acanthoscelides obtectus]CAK1666728.1 tRNA-specific adenosine deaminase 1 [Acanthoscelides obtectus]
MNSDKNFYNTVAQVCFKHFKTLPKTGKPNNTEWTILSCIVLENGGSFEVVALGTGTKCIGKDKMLETGDILNDSHAEVICRRAFIRYIFHQMKKDDSPLLIFDTQSKKFTLKPNTKFHFFTTHVPCGDAAIFPRQDAEDFGDLIPQKDNETLSESTKSGAASGTLVESSEIPLKRRKINANDYGLSDSRKLDIHRTGAKCLATDKKQDSKLPGPAYHTLGCVRTKPGRGVPTLSVSCSDKLSKWCHLGVQGAFLSLLLEAPLYLSSFTIAGKTPFCIEALQRALFGRLGEVTVELPYARHTLFIGQSDMEFEFSKRDDRKPCSSCIIWCRVPSQSLEVAVDGKRQGVVKKKQNTSVARLKICKLELFKLFKEVCDARNIIQEKDDASYDDFKQLSTGYQRAWDCLRKCFRTWTVKDKGLLKFNFR